MIETRLMGPDDEADVNAIYAGWSHQPRTTMWWWAHPTVVAVDGHRVIGYASFTISLPPTPNLASLHQAEIGWGHGMAVHPDYQGQGIGRQLVEARSDVMRELGLRFFIGHAAPGNQRMESLFAEQGLKATVTAPQPDGTDLTYYMGRI